VPLCERRADLPPSLERMIMACLHKEPSDRPATADVLLQVLDGIATAGGRVRPSAMRNGSSFGPLSTIATALKSMFSRLSS
jgi:hypothetical protein